MVTDIPTDDEDTEEISTGNSLFLAPKKVSTVYSADDMQVKTRILSFDFTRQCHRCFHYKPTFSGKFRINPNVCYMPYEPSQWICTDCLIK